MPRLGKDFLNSELRRIKTAHEEKWLLRRPCPVVPTDNDIFLALKNGAFKVTKPNCGCEVRAVYNGYSERIDADNFIKVPLLVNYRKAVKRHKQARKLLTDCVAVKSNETFKAIYYGQVGSEEALKMLEAFAKWKPNPKKWNDTFKVKVR